MLTTLGCLICLCACASSVLSVSTRTLVGACIRRTYDGFRDERHIAEDGQVLHCNGTVRVWACWGRCATEEVPDYVPPFYKKSRHYRCLPTRLEVRAKVLRNCDPDHPYPYALVHDAMECSCEEEKQCNKKSYYNCMMHY